MKNKEILNTLYTETRKSHEEAIHQKIKSTMEKIKANKSKLQSIKDSGVYASNEIKTQEAKTREANAKALDDLREDLSKIKLQAIEAGKKKDTELGALSDLEVANMLSVLAISTKSIKEQDLISMYEDGYFNPMLKLGIEAIASEKRYTLQKPNTAADMAQRSFVDSIKSFANTLAPFEINDNIEVISSVMRLTKNDLNA